MSGPGKIKERGGEEVRDVRTDRTEREGSTRVSPHLLEQGTTRRTGRQESRYEDGRPSLDDLGAPRDRDLSRDAARFDPAAGNRLGLKDPSSEAAGDSTQVMRGEAARASVVSDIVEAGLDVFTAARSFMILSAYSFEKGYAASVAAWGGNAMRTRLEDLARSPFADASVVQEAKATLEALERLRRDPADAKALAQAESWFRRYDGRNKDVTELDREVHRAEGDWKAVDGAFGDLRIQVEEPLITQVPVYWEGAIMPAELVRLREAGDVLGVDVRHVSPVDVAAARLDGRTDIPVGEITVWTSETADLEAVQDAVLRALPEGSSVRIPESEIAFSVATQARLVLTVPGFEDLRFVIRIEAPPSVLVDFGP